MRKLSFVILLFIASQNIFAQSGWQWQNPKPSGTGFCDAAYLDANTIYALGSTGEFLKSFDGGTTWSIKNLINHENFTTRDFVKMSVVNAQNIFALSEINRTPLRNIYTIYKSTDGGNQWSNNSLDTLYGTWLNDIKFTNAFTGYCFNNFNDSPKNLFKTTDAGATWNRITINGADTLYSLAFINENTGWVLGPSNSIFKTTNGGINWTSYPLPVSNGNYEQTFFINANTGWILKSPGIFRTINGGASFTLLGNINIPSGYKFFNETTGFLSANNKLYKTINSGANWTLIDNIRASRFNFLNSTTGLLTGSFGEISKTTNTGQNWVQLSRSALPVTNVITAIDFSDENSGWAVGGNRLLKTTNGGNEWISQPDSSKEYSSVKFLNQNTGTYSAYGGIYLTTNGGGNWALVTGSNYSNITFRNVRMASSNTWYCAGKDGLGTAVILKTTNTGANWQTISLPPPEFTDIVFADANIGYLSTFGGIYKTTNGASSWSLLTTTFLNSLSFINANTGWGLSSNIVYRTINGGINWTPLFTDNNFSIYTIKFTNELTGWGVGYIGNSINFGRIIKTTNGGANFFYTNYASYSRLSTISILNANTLWAGGEYGAIVKTTTGGNVFVSQISSETPDNFSLLQNYPNPFNPATVIRYQLSVPGNVSLKVFDLLGKEVASLVNEKQNAGRYAVDFNSAEYNLPSGIYFYTLSAGEFKETRKMVLVK